MILYHDRLLCLWQLMLLVILAGNTAAAETAYAVKEQHQVPAGWQLLRRAPAETIIHLQILLTQSNFAELERQLYQVSDPSHSQYGEFLSAQQVNALVQPNAESIDLVETWLADHGISMSNVSRSPALDWLAIVVPVSVAENLLRTDFSEYRHPETDSSAIRAPTWSLPRHLHEHIESIQPTSSFVLASRLQRRDVDKGVGSLNDAADEISASTLPGNLDIEHLPPDLTVSQACNASAVSPLCVRVLYGAYGYQVQAADRNAMALVNFDGEFNNRSDAHLFLQRHRPEAAKSKAAYKFKTVDVAGAVNQQTEITHEQREHKSGREGALDVQTLLGIAYPTSLIAYSVGGPAPPFTADKFTPTNTNEPFLTWLNYILEQEQLPQVVAVSYGDIEQTVPRAYAKRVCQAFAQLGARGTTVIFGAGDFGVGRQGYCRANDGSEREEFLVSFPASCPYGTSVGATRGVAPEGVAYNDNNGFVSGGGFSRYFPRPAYQDHHHVVSDYLDKLGNDTYAGLFDRKGRAYPDVAAQGYRKAIVWDGKEYLVDGTSASAPTFAAIVALVNDALVAAGRPALGFLNPWLYAEGYKAFTDVTDGSTKGCSTKGYPAGPGWDAGSGFGTPWFPKFKEMALARKFRSKSPWYWPVSW